jgi:hypothetical protein
MNKITYFKIKNSFVIITKIFFLNELFIANYNTSLCPFSNENVHSADLAHSRVKPAEADIVTDDELARLEIVMDEEEEEDHPKKPQQTLSSQNGTDITISKMMTEVNDHHDSGFMENGTNKQQQHDGDDTQAER